MFPRSKGTFLLLGLELSNPSLTFYLIYSLKLGFLSQASSINSDPTYTCISGLEFPFLKGIFLPSKFPDIPYILLRDATNPFCSGFAFLT